MHAVSRSYLRHVATCPRPGANSKLQSIEPSSLSRSLRLSLSSCSSQRFQPNGWLRGNCWARFFKVSEWLNRDHFSWVTSKILSAIEIARVRRHGMHRHALSLGRGGSCADASNWSCQWLSSHCHDWEAMRWPPGGSCWLLACHPRTNMLGQTWPPSWQLSALFSLSSKLWPWLEQPRFSG